MTECVRQAIANGITVGMGTDASCPFSTQYGMWRELVYFAVLGGFGAKKALEVATVGNAAVVGQSDRIGTLEAGKRADILLLRDNPADDLFVLRSPAAVVAGGRLIENPTPKRNAEIEGILDKLMEEMTNG